MTTINDLDAQCTDSGNSISSCPEGGGNNIEILGTNLNAIDTNVTVAGNHCPIQEADSTRIVCQLPAAGNPFWDAEVKVTAFAETTTWPGLVSYIGPTITSGPPMVDAIAATTTGGETVTVHGTGFSTTPSEMSVFYGPSEEPLRYTGVITALTSTSEFEFQLVSGVGKLLKITVSVNGVHTQPSSEIVSYPAPQFSAGSFMLVSNPQVPSGIPRLLNGTSTNGDIIMANGLNFGSDASMISVSLIQSGTGREIACLVDVFGSENTDTKIKCRIEPGEGFNYLLTAKVPATGSSVQVARGPDSYSYPDAPIVTAVLGCTENGDTTTLCPTTGKDHTQTQMTITIVGEKFGPDTTIDVGGLYCLNPIVNGEGTEVTCLLREGAGLLVSITATSDSLTSLPKNILSYALPTISGISGCPEMGCSRDGGDVITIDGNNFGSDNAVVLIGGSRCSSVTHVVGSEHTQVTCVMPAGTGIDRSVILLQNEGELTISTSTISYQTCGEGHYPSSNSTECLSCREGTFAESA